MNVRLVTNPSNATPANPDGIRLFTGDGREITDVRTVTYRSGVGCPPTVEVEIIRPHAQIDVLAEAEFVGPGVRVLLDALGLGGCETIGEARQFLKNSGVALTL